MRAAEKGELVLFSYWIGKGYTFAGHVQAKYNACFGEGGAGGIEWTDGADLAWRVSAIEIHIKAPSLTLRDAHDHDATGNPLSQHLDQLVIFRCIPASKGLQNQTLQPRQL